MMRHIKSIFQLKKNLYLQNYIPFHPRVLNNDDPVSTHDP